MNKKNPKTKTIIELHIVEKYASSKKFRNVEVFKIIELVEFVKACANKVIKQSTWYERLFDKKLLTLQIAVLFKSSFEEFVRNRLKEDLNKKK